MNLTTSLQTARLSDAAKTDSEYSSDIENHSEYRQIDARYRTDIEQFSAYLRLKECDELIEGFISSGHLLKSLQFDPSHFGDALLGITGSIGRREAHTFYSDYDVVVFGGDRLVRDKALSHLISINPNAKFDKRELFSVGRESNENEKLKDFYYPVINPDTIEDPDTVYARVWLLTEFVPLTENELYREIQKTVVDYYDVFSTESQYAKPQRLLEELTTYRRWLAGSLRGSHVIEQTDSPALVIEAKTIARKLAYLFNTLAVVRLVCRKSHIASRDIVENLRSQHLFANMRAPTICKIGYWFSEEFHHEKPMRRFDSEANSAASSEVYERYLEFLRKNSPEGRGRVIYKLCEKVPAERLVRRLFKRTCVELIENYNESVKRIWTPDTRVHLSKSKPGPAIILESEPELDNIMELSRRVLWPLFALSKLLEITFETAAEWGYFEGQTYPASGRAIATSWLVRDTEQMLTRAIGNWRI